MAEDFGRRLPYLMRRVNGALSQRLDEDLREFDLTQSQLSALALLDLEHPAGLSAATLSARSGVTPQSMSAAIAGLVQRGLVARTPHATHGRILECRITTSGTDVLAHVQRATRDSSRYDGGLSSAQQENLRELLTEMMHALGLYLPVPETLHPRQAPADDALRETIAVLADESLLADHLTGMAEVHGDDVLDADSLAEFLAATKTDDE